MKIGIITTSRADFGIYMPLLDCIKERKHRYLIFAGGMHLSKMFGESYRLIEESGYHIAEKIMSLTDDDTPEGIGLSMAKTMDGYVRVWNKYRKKIDVLFVLGDRFEMFAAANSAILFNFSMAHLHGGETTLGAIDNKFRHAITALSDYHFASSVQHAKRVTEITGSTKNIFNVGALGIDAIKNMPLFSNKDFFERFNFNPQEPFILTTYHPETVALNNKYNIKQLILALKKIQLKVLCTLPNADTEGSLIRKELLDYEKQYPNKIKCFENLGQKGYYSAMKFCSIILGNTSSGIIEAASFNKRVINVGDRQKGRMTGKNVVHVPNDSIQIINAYNELICKKEQKFKNPYGDGSAAAKIIAALEKIYN